MRKIACVAPALALAACAVAPVSPVAPDAPSAGRGASCNAAAVTGFVGQARTTDTETAILAATGATKIRWATPDTMMTMEFSADRVTVYLSADGRITRIVCG